MHFNTTCFYAGQDPPQLEFFTFIFNNSYGFLKISTSTIVRYFCVMKWLNPWAGDAKPKVTNQTSHLIRVRALCVIVKLQTSRRFDSSSNSTHSNCLVTCSAISYQLLWVVSLGGVWPGHGAQLRLAPRQGAEVAQLDQNLHLAILDIRCLSIMLLTTNGYSIDICLSNYLFRVHWSERERYFLFERVLLLPHSRLGINRRTSGRCWNW